MADDLKQKSRKRFEQMNHIVDHLVKRLDGAEQGAMFLFFRHADENGEFCVSAKRLADGLGISVRHSKRVFRKLEEKYAIEVLSEAVGTRPRAYRITGEVSCGDTDVASNSASTPD